MPIFPEGGFTLLYLHIPKTAGTALTSFLCEHYVESTRFHIVGPDYRSSEAKLRGLSPASRENIAYVHGHFSFGVHEAFSKRCQYYTVMRDPIDRVTSLYFFIRSTPRHPRHHEVAALNLKEFAVSGLHPEIENCQTKMLSGRESTNFLTGKQKCNEIDFARAKEHLDAHFLGCGIFEDLPRSLFLLCRSMGWGYSGLPRLNVTPRRLRSKELSFEEYEALKLVNEYDIKLYEYAKMKFTIAVARMTIGQRCQLLLNRLAAGMGMAD